MEVSPDSGRSNNSKDFNELKSNKFFLTKMDQTKNIPSNNIRLEFGD
jgi:hypothetical protein